MTASINEVVSRTCNGSRTFQDSSTQKNFTCNALNATSGQFDSSDTSCITACPIPALSSFGSYSTCVAGQLMNETETCDVNCSTGYELDALGATLHTMTCNSSGMVSLQENCTADPEYCTLAASGLDNATIEATVNSVISRDCATGLGLQFPDGTTRKYLRCDPLTATHGRFNDTRASCFANTCSLPPNVTNSVANSCSGQNASSFVWGSSCQYTCANEYESNSFSSTIRCNYGTWSSLECIQSAKLVASTFNITGIDLVDIESDSALKAQLLNE
eukprot:486831_1